MAHGRSGHETDGILVGCSICGNAFLYPQDGRYCRDRLFRCNHYCNETELPIDYWEKNGQGAKQADPVSPFPVGPKPTGHES